MAPWQVCLSTCLGIPPDVSWLQVSVGGDPNDFAGNPAPPTGNLGIRIFEPCASPSGQGCLLFEDPATVHLAARRWYTSAIRIFDGSLLIAGGTHEDADFYNIDPENTFEFFPPKDNVSQDQLFVPTAS